MLQSQDKVVHFYQYRHQNWLSLIGTLVLEFDKNSSVTFSIESSHLLFQSRMFYLSKYWDFESPLPKFCRTFPTMMKLGIVVPELKKTQKLYKSHDTTHTFCWHEYFFTGNHHFCLEQEIETEMVFQYVVSNSFNFKFLKVVLVNMVAILMMKSHFLKCDNAKKNQIHQ